MAGLRERKKARTREAISEAAIGLFLERGYDTVSVADVAAAAEVSKRTLFAYFPSKDDLVLHRFADHQDEPARVVRTRQPGEAPLDALHRHLRSALERRDPIGGLCDHPAVVRFYGLVLGTPALGAALGRYQARGEDALAAALGEAVPGDELVARLAAGQILVTLRILGHANQVRIADGRSADDLAADAVAEADAAFALLRHGLAPYRAVSPPDPRR
jgi:AcrR family transcriptional regulator